MRGPSVVRAARLRRRSSGAGPQSAAGMSFVLDLPDADATLRAGAALSRALRGGMVVTIEGDLGAGKTTLVRGMLRGMGFEGAVKSPTYTLVEHYPFSSIYFYHFDFYRLANADEWEGAGLAECFRDDSVCVIEWPERVRDRIPAADLALALAHAAHGRTLTVRPTSEAGERCEAALRQAFRAT
jgi:tRNA threonylcarbamoyladenosine biosynthesis protein TsaE